MDAARAALAAARETGAHVVAKDAYGRLLAPVTGMDKVICIGMNYKDHCEEMGAPLPEEPRVFCKFPSCVSAGGDPIPLSEGGVRTEQLDVEVEMAVVIGRECLNVAVEDARAYVAGYTVANDLSARDHQFNRCGRHIAIGRRIAIAAEGTWLCSIPARPIAPPCQRLHRCPIARHYSVISYALTLGTHHTTPLFSGNLWLIGKAGPGYCPLGPAIVTEDELGDPHNLVLGSWVNGERWQGSKTDQLVHRVDEAVSFISRCVGPIRVYVYRVASPWRPL